ncbi:hypothetical protein IGB42_01104 [Andreprevotia sp. IGB-42]|uniref:hypothetical protein n=1 Tax=Andreprevotia sp. IGB-42 TaxID=2497473 RepID=UPI00135B5E6E|nr:hypothetical protein [Andreprevotia sp. IGB-42]KAF0814207.1 hypothetical protein IGB42_01104 [Andreprevotia sp. IGB-42]
MKTAATIAILLTLLPALPGTAWAAPAGWYTWKSKLDGKLICVQSNPGSGWEQHKGPFADNTCTPPDQLPTTTPRP